MHNIEETRKVWFHSYIYIELYFLLYNNCHTKMYHILFYKIILEERGKYKQIMTISSNSIKVYCLIIIWMREQKNLYFMISESFLIYYTNVYKNTHIDNY